MATSKQKAFCVLQFAKTESAITVQRAFRIQFGCQPPNDNILWWFHQFETTGCLSNWKSGPAPFDPGPGVADHCSIACDLPHWLSAHHPELRTSLFGR
ncbi:DUF4817 domain-containing protein [Trichonephila clavipes]|uniref:DUF4817 domain-containing protein n=1 Tax=Trichonephila clavipes TaxID=2585209 RepID=A0A8X6UZJ2_TRICX|nr:DUF4817 domain-containing protein [Trichonephila clavipes]